LVSVESVTGLAVAAAEKAITVTAARIVRANCMACLAGQTGFDELRQIRQSSWAI
jgi:hypothetical protein